MRRVLPIVGRVLVTLVGLLMLFAGSGKAFGFAPDEVVATLDKAGLGDWRQIIGLGSMATGLLLALPWTARYGVLAASSYWGGAIVTHMGLGDSFAPPATLLAITWVGAILLDVNRLGPAPTTNPAAKS